MKIYFENRDVARALDLSSSTIRVLIASGTLVPTARTRRGVYLFDPDSIEVLRRQRAEADAD